MGNILSIIEMMAFWEIIAVVIGLPLCGIGLFYLLRIEFRYKSAISLSSFFTLLTITLVQNEIKIHYYLNTADAETLNQESDQLWEYSKYQQSYEKLEQAIRVARFQNENDTLIASYEKLIDRYFKQPSYLDHIQYTQWEIDALEYSKNYLQDTYDEKLIINDQDQLENFYNNLFNIDIVRNDPFEETLYYFSYDRISPSDDQSKIIRAAYQRALIIIAQSIEAGNLSIPPSMLGKYYSALSMIEESRNKFTKAYEYAIEAKYYWDDFRPKIQVVRLAFKLEKENVAHELMDSIVNIHTSSGHKIENENFIIELATMDLNYDHLSHSRKILKNLKKHLETDLTSFQFKLDKMNFELRNNAVTVNSNIYPFLSDVKSLRERLKKVNNYLSEINNRYSSKAYMKELISRQLENNNDTNQALKLIYEAIDYAELANNQKYLFRYHMRASNLLNKSGQYSEAINHALLARDIHDGENGLIINSKRENDISRIYPEILKSQLGLGLFKEASKTLNILNQIGKSLDYAKEPNTELYEYYKGRVLYYAFKGELLRAELYYDDAVSYLLKSAKQKEVHVNAEVSANTRFINNMFESYLIELKHIHKFLFTEESFHGSQKDKMLMH